jgi:hypothetical protein
MRKIFLAMLFSFSVAASAAPSADLWERWTKHDETNRDVIDHGAWDEFLGKYVKGSADGINRVAYGSVTAADKSRLADYLSKMERVGISKYARAEQRAYWINLYNATTIKAVLDYYPVKSIRKINISPGLFESGPWGAKLLKVEGEQLSLNDIEHRILRPIWKDPRTHYAVNCASLGCPNLAPRAYTAVLMEGLLDDGARAYINHPRGVEIKDGLLYVSSIYRWFRSDFGGSDANVIAHLLDYARPELADELRGKKDIIGDRYDWSLNDAS